MSTTPTEHFTFETPGTHTIVHVQGAPEREPKALTYTGRIDAPSSFLKPKEGNYDPKRATATIDTDAGSITLVLDEKEHATDTITGKLEPETSLVDLGVNSATKKYDSKDLAKVVKRLGHLFPNREEHVTLMARLNNFSARVTKFTEDNLATSGNAKKSLETVVDGFDPISFKLQAPVFKGGEKQIIRVDVGVDASSNNVLLFLDSQDLYDLDASLRQELLKKEAEYFTSLGVAVLYKS
ncbi:hypothetical protein [Hymenobacter metallicola]|uniref:Uncharacterized protein n=1 Tax=Hymenobacter metallicola TaxID=2563114 RepID=A0A4Z0QID5_9BACT|nr:hypothetical protein [Hymenobacter metallicola]TGE29760.1 hypothetical protein E5K02_09960 [Hymenobacter metallicola]